MKKMKLILIVSMLLSCSGDDQITQSEPEVVRDGFAEFINPTNTDPEIDVINENFHYAIFNELENERGELLIFLGGTMSRTSGTAVFSEFAANRGFHVINLAYPNLTPILVCRDESDTDCALKFRKEIFEGFEESDYVNVDPANSIKNRIQKLLMHLAGIDPQGKWEQYVSSGQIVWSKILVGGHSQGAGHAAFIANQLSIKRSLMFAGPNDWSDFHQESANWLSSNVQTALDKQYAFLHLRDEVSDFKIQEQSLMALGFEFVFDSDNSMPPFEMNNALFTDKEPDNHGGFGAPFHGSVVNDGFTPFENGQPVHSDVWEYMLGVN